MSWDWLLVGCHILEAVVVELTREVLRREVVGGGDGPCHGELARGVHLAGEQVGNRVAALHAWLPSAENGIGVTAP